MFPRCRKPTRRTRQETRRSDKFCFCAAARLDGKANGRKAGSRTSRHHKTKSYCDSRGVPDVREDFPIAPGEFRNGRMGDQDHVRPPRLQPALPQATNSMQKNPRPIQSSLTDKWLLSHLFSSCRYFKSQPVLRAYASVKSGCRTLDRRFMTIHTGSELYDYGHQQVCPVASWGGDLDPHMYCLPYEYPRS